VKTGAVRVGIDPRYFRPTEVEALLGDPSKAEEKLGWTARTSLSVMVKEMVADDLNGAEKEEMLRREGFQTFDYYE
jgi:GDPmannose 4,6-dehydratase